MYMYFQGLCGYYEKFGKAEDKTELVNVYEQLLELQSRYGFMILNLIMVYLIYIPSVLKLPRCCKCLLHKF